MQDSKLEFAGVMYGLLIDAAPCNFVAMIGQKNVIFY